MSLSSSTPTYMTYTASDSAWLTTNAAGDETGFWGYDAFGNLAFGTPTSPFGYAGQYTDPSTGFSDMRARWYAPQTGNFTTRDPVFASTDTAYTYAGDDPVNAGDPSGMITVGLCVNGTANIALGFAVGIGGQVCVQSDLMGNYGLTATLGIPGYGAGGNIGVNVSVQVTSASKLASLEGYSWAISTAGKYEGGIQGDFFWGIKNAPSGGEFSGASNGVFGADLGVGPGFALDITDWLQHTTSLHT
ncbi:MAG: RHS repeat-associated core domain-containing protein, partial [Acidimicrobiales bacterium]